MSAPSAPPPQRAILGVAFLSLFLDLIGFSIVFPLFPQMLAHYQAHEADGGLFALLYAGLEQFSALAGAPEQAWGIKTLFGGVLASVYSLLQFACTPFFGSLSDRIGRRPVMLISVGGMALSYAVWFFADSFALLVLSRLIGGIMSANISTVSAVVADVTTPETRPKGMAVIGVAFGLGFILGPAVGALTALIDLREWWPGGVAVGLNPYSMPALVAFLLSVVNLVWVYTHLPETRAPRADPDTDPVRTLNPFRILAMPSAGVVRTSLAYFLFLIAFSGMEFSLTFLAADRLGYTERQNALMFVFVGVVLAIVQGGYVRRVSDRIGPRRMTQHGLVTLTPGLALIGLAGALRSQGLLYLGLALMACGAAQTMPCLSALASLYAPAHEQGRILGMFRSLGALGRAIGPLAACVLYWRLGSTPTYLLGAASLAAPIALARSLPRIEKV